MKIKIRKIKYKTNKFFGHPEDNWARLSGKNGKKRSYGHYSGTSDLRTVEEIRNADEKKLNEGEQE